MPVDTRHPEYAAFEGYWQQMRDAAAGEDAVRERATSYIPVPPDMEGGAQNDYYRAYVRRARYPDAIQPAVQGMVGLMSRKPPDIKLPDALEYMREQATADGLPLDALIDRMRQEISLVGRYVLLVDVDEEGNPYIATYPAEAAINWRGDGERLDLLVLEETVEDDSGDPFAREMVMQWRACRIEDGQYIVELYRKDEDGNIQHHETVEPVRKGDPLDFVPAVIVGSRDLLPAPDSMPLLPVARKCAHYYRQYADYAQQLYWCAMGTTPYAAGVDKESLEKGETPATVGPGAFHAFEDPNAKLSFAEISGTGLEQQRSELERIEQEIIRSTVQAMSESKRDAEAAETLRLRFQAQTATLSSIAMSTARGIERALRYCAYWAGVASEPTEESVTVEQSTAFITEQPDPNMLTAIYDGIERGFIPQEILARYTRRTELHEFEDEEFVQRTAEGLAEAPEDDG